MSEIFFKHGEEIIVCGTKCIIDKTLCNPLSMNMTKNEMLDHPAVIDNIVDGKLSSFDNKTRICEVING